MQTNSNEHNPNFSSTHRNPNRHNPSSLSAHNKPIEFFLRKQREEEESHKFEVLKKQRTNTERDFK